MPKRGTPEASFGLSVGAVFVLIGVYANWHGRTHRALVSGSVGLVLMGLGWLRPLLLRVPSLYWWRFAHMLAALNTRVILTVVFALVFIPMNVIWRLIGHDPLRRRRHSSPGWTPYPTRYRNPVHYLRMY